MASDNRKSDVERRFGADHRAALNRRSGVDTFQK
jgi:hypothetical protein